MKTSKGYTRVRANESTIVSNIFIDNDLAMMIKRTNKLIYMYVKHRRKR
jgi:hypothetical protein